MKADTKLSVLTMTLKEMLPELNQNQLKMLKRIIMDGLPTKEGNIRISERTVFFGMESSRAS